MNQPCLTDVDELIPLIYQGPLEPVPWKGFLKALRRRADCDGAALVLRPAGELAPSAIWDLSDALDETRFAGPYDDTARLSLKDPIAVMLTKPGDIYTLDEVISREALQANEVYRRFMKPANIDHQIGMYVSEPGGWTCNLGLLNGTGRDRFDEPHKRFLIALRQHFEPALALYSRLNRAESEREIFEETLERLSVGIILFDLSGNVIECNRIARDLLERTRSIRLHQKKVILEDSRRNADFQSLVRAALARQSEAGNQFVDVMKTGESEGVEIGILVRSVPPSRYQGNASPAVAIYVAETSQRQLISDRFLATLFGLTPTEAFLTTLLVSGYSLCEAAEKLDVTENTVRGYLKRIFSKTGANRQAELVRLVLKSVALLA